MKLNLLYLYDKGNSFGGYPNGVVEIFNSYCYYFDTSFAISTTCDASVIENLIGSGDYTVVVDSKKSIVGGKNLLKNYFENSLGLKFYSNTFNETNYGKVIYLFDDEEGRAFLVDEVIKEFNIISATGYAKQTFCFVGADRLELEDVLGQAVNASEDKLKFHIFQDGALIKLNVVYDDNTPKMIMDKLTKSLIYEFGDYLYAETDETLVERLMDVAKLRRVKIGVAESFTGGNIAKTIVEKEGASEILYEGLVCYDANAKTERLGVDRKIIIKNTAVCQEVASQMVEGLLSTGNVGLAIATTGVAGPNADSSGFPAGYCFLAIGTAEKINVYRYKFDGNRQEVIDTATKHALLLAIKMLKDM